MRYGLAQTEKYRLRVAVKERIFSNKYHYTGAHNPLGNVCMRVIYGVLNPVVSLLVSISWYTRE